MRSPSSASARAAGGSSSPRRVRGRGREAFLEKPCLLASTSLALEALVEDAARQLGGGTSRGAAPRPSPRRSASRSAACAAGTALERLLARARGVGELLLGLSRSASSARVASRPLLAAAAVSAARRPRGAAHRARRGRARRSARGAPRSPARASPRARPRSPATRAAAAVLTSASRSRARSTCDRDARELQLGAMAPRLETAEPAASSTSARRSAGQARIASTLPCPMIECMPLPETKVGEGLDEVEPPHRSRFRRYWPSRRGGGGGRPRSSA